MFGRVHLPILRAEVAAARLEAAISADPDLEALWRAEAAIVEAVASVTMEDVKILEGDLLVSIAENRALDIDARGVGTAWSVLRFLRAPGDVLADPVAVIRRIEAACGKTPEEDAPVSDEEIRWIADAIRGMEEVPVAAALRASAIYGMLTMRRAPAAERLLFCAVDAALRGRAGRRAPRDEADHDLHHLHPRPGSGPVVMPATALGRAGRVIWSPLRLGAIPELAEGLARGTSWDLGQIGVLRGQLAALRKAGEGRHGRSRTGDLCAWLSLHPVITSGAVMEGIGISRRGALDLISGLEAAGILRQVTRRKTARIWATASLADRLSHRTTHQPAVARLVARQAPVRDVAAPGPGTPYDGAETQRRMREENREAIERALEAMDRAMAEADGILAGIHRAGDLGRGPDDAF